MSRTPYFPFYPADFMNGVRGLTPQEVGVYTMLLCRIYEENGPVEYHIRRLSTYCGMREATFIKTVETLFDLGKLTLSDGQISNARAEIEISKRANGLEIASRAGKASAEKRQQNQRQEATTVHPAFNHTDTDTELEKEEPNGSSKKRAARRCRLPPEWVPSDRNIDDAIARQFSEQDIDREATAYRDYHLAKGTLNADWDAAWRTWLGNARKFAAGRMAGNASPGGRGQGGSLASIAARRRFAGEG